MVQCERYLQQPSPPIQVWFTRTDFTVLTSMVDMQPTDMHSLLLQPQPQLLQPLQPLTATVTAGCTQLTPTMPLPLPPAMELALWRVCTEVATADLPPTEVT